MSAAVSSSSLAQKIQPYSRQLIIWLLLAMAIGTRFAYLAHDSLWLDEVLTHQFASAEMSFTQADSDHPALYYLSVWASLKLLGDTEWALRFSSAVAGVLSVAVLVWLGGVLKRPWIGVIAGLLLVLSPFHLRYSQEARSYAFMMLWSLLTYITLYKAITNERDWKWWAGFGFVTLLNLYTHYSALLVLAGETLVLSGWCVWQIKRRQFKTIFYPMATGLLIAIGFLPEFWELQTTVARNSADSQLVWSGVTPILIWLQEAIVIFGMRSFGLPYLFVGVFLLGILALVRGREWLLLGLITFGIGTPFLIIGLLQFDRWAFPKYIIYLLPLYLVVASIGLQQIVTWLSHMRGDTIAWRATVAAGFLFMAAGFALLQQEYNYVERDWRALAQVLKAAVEPDDVIYSFTLDIGNGFEQGGRTLPYYLDHPLVSAGLLTEERVRPHIQGDGRVWGVVLDRSPPFLELDESTEVVDFGRGLYLVDLNSSRDLLTQTIDLYEFVMPAAQPDTPLCLLEQDLAAVQASGGLFEAAEVSLNRAIAHCPRHPVGEFDRRMLQTRVYAQRLETHTQNGMVAEAREMAVKLLRLDTKNQQALNTITLVNVAEAFTDGSLHIVNQFADEPISQRRFTMPQDGDWGDVLFAHPPARFQLTAALPPEPVTLQFRAAMSPESWTWGGDGSTFIVSAVTANDQTIELFRQHISNSPDNQRWHAAELSLEQFAGEEITLVFETTAGPAGNSAGDWAGWEIPRIVWR